jgi:cell division septation protein DedD
MDQNSTNGSGPDKRNWRERLGIGAKEMPKLSDEFRDGSESSDQARQPPAGAQPVARPAPMAPRAPRAASASETPSAPPPRATPRSPDNAAQDALADKLRAQRAAAERLAEQRVQAARERAEGRTPPPEAPSAAPRAPSATRSPPPPPPPRSPRASVPPPPAGGRPKFSFAEEPPPGRSAGDVPPRPGMSGSPLSPPRTSLGGERGQPPFLRPSAPGAASRPQPPYRPVDPAASYGAPPRLQPPPGRPGYGVDPGAPGYPAPRGPQRRPPALESYPRQAERDFGDAEQDEARQVPRLGRPARGRGPDDFDEVFEDDGGARPRASARDYQSAYGEGEDAFAEDQRRSGGPWLLLLALLAAALVTGGVVWYYNAGMGNVAGTGTSTGEVPVVNAPADPAKVAPEAPAGGAEEPAAKRKQIYDRIVGDQEVIGGGQMQPTEEIPVQPAAAQPLNEVPAAADTNPIPAPDAEIQGTGADGLPSVDEPPPLPLPPADQQGSIGNSTTQQIAATAAPPGEGATAPPPLPEPEITSTSSSSSAAPAPPPPETATDGAALVSADPPAPAEVAEVEPPPPPKKKPAAAKKKPVEENLGAEPVVLVPPAENFSAGAETASNEAIAVPDQPAAPAEKKPRSIMDLFRGDGADDTAAAAPPQPRTQVAAVEPPPPAPAAPARQQAEAPPATGSGFVVQLSSFRSEADARKEYTRLAGAYPDVVGGLPQQIRQTSVGGSTRYQLGLGPLPSRSAATKVCSALITQGESDCIVRGR